MEQKMFLTIGPVNYQILSENKLVADETCANFVSAEAAASDTIVAEVRAVSLLKEPAGRLVHRGAQRLVYREDNGREHRVNIWENQLMGIYHETDETHITVEIPVEPDTAIPVSTTLLELFALEKYLLRYQALVLHSSFIEYQGKAILFTAPSGTGKSTQAALWVKYEGTETLNGDRSIVQRTAAGTFVAHGLPFCGSSQIHVNKTLPLGAIIFIEQHPTNVVEPMNPAQAYGKLYGEMSINSWNRIAVEQSLQIIETLVAGIPMVHLKCNMEQDAVNTLKHYLHENAGF